MNLVTLLWIYSINDHHFTFFKSTHLSWTLNKKLVLLIFLILLLRANTITIPIYTLCVWWLLSKNRNQHCWPQKINTPCIICQSTILAALSCCWNAALYIFTVERSTLNQNCASLLCQKSSFKRHLIYFLYSALRQLLVCDKHAACMQVHTK
jgi:hypothetical protein